MPIELAFIIVFVLGILVGLELAVMIMGSYKLL